MRDILAHDKSVGLGNSPEECLGNRAEESPGAGDGD